MTSPTTTDLLTFFEIQKPKETIEGQKVAEAATGKTLTTASKPNVEKVEMLSAANLLAAFTSQSGMGTILAAPLLTTRKAAAVVLDMVDDEDFEKTKGIVLAQLAVLTDQIKALTPESAKAIVEQVGVDIKKLFKMKASGQASAVGQGEEPTDDPSTDQVDKSLQEALGEALGKKKPGGNIH